MLLWKAAFICEIEIAVCLL